LSPFPFRLLPRCRFSGFPRSVPLPALFLAACFPGLSLATLAQFRQLHLHCPRAPPSPVSLFEVVACVPLALRFTGRRLFAVRLSVWVLSPPVVNFLDCLYYTMIRGICQAFYYIFHYALYACIPCVAWVTWFGYFTTKYCFMFLHSHVIDIVKVAGNRIGSLICARISSVISSVYQ
jgi:hypothetical protein